MVQRDIPPNNNLEKLTRDAQQLAPEKEKQYWKSNNCWLNKEENSGLGQIIIQYWFPLLTIIDALNHWSTDKMISFMNQYW